MEAHLATFAFPGSLIRDGDPILWACEVLRGLFRSGWEIHILSPGTDRKAVKLFIDRLGLPVSVIHMDVDGPTLVIEIGSDLHFDQDDKAIRFIIEYGIPCIKVAVIA